MSGVNFAEIEKDFVREKIYDRFDWLAFDTFSPLNPLRKPLSSARVAFVTTSGAHLADHEPFDLKAPEGDPTYRAFPSVTPLASLQLTHRGYDTRKASEDKNVVLPLDHLRQAVETGRIGELTPTVYSFMGYIADSAPLVDVFAREVAALLRQDRADLVLLAPT
jgi:D-proline reductase (dithiol) PrdB